MGGDGNMRESRLSQGTERGVLKETTVTGVHFSVRRKSGASNLPEIFKDDPI